MRFVELQAGETVFEYGDVGELFYVIIEGTVAIQTPSYITLEDEQVTAQGFLIYILEHFRDIKWDSMRDGDSIRNLIIQELRYFKM